MNWENYSAFYGISYLCTSHECNGYVHLIYQDLCRDKQDASFFLCGWKHMIDEAKKIITEMGYDRKAIHQELYG